MLLALASIAARLADFILDLILAAEFFSLEVEVYCSTKQQTTAITIVATTNSWTTGNSGALG